VAKEYGGVAKYRGVWRKYRGVWRKQRVLGDINVMHIAPLTRPLHKVSTSPKALSDLRVENGRSREVSQTACVALV
jgi:hypothetical protein